MLCRPRFDRFPRTVRIAARHVRRSAINQEKDLKKMTKHQSTSAFPQVLETIVSKAQCNDPRSAAAAPEGKAAGELPDSAPRGRPRLPRVASSS